MDVAVCAGGATSPLQPTNSISAAVIRRSGMRLDSFMSEPPRSASRIDFPLASENVLESFIKDKRNTKGLTPSGEEWLRDTVGRFLRWLPVPLPQSKREHVVRFLGLYDTKPWRKHARTGAEKEKRSTQCHYESKLRYWEYPLHTLVCS